MKWSEKDLSTARVIVSATPTLQGGFDAAAKVLGTTSIAVQRQYERGRLGKIAPKAQADEVALYREKAKAQAREQAHARLVKELAEVQDELAVYKTITRAPKPLRAAVTTAHSKQRKGVAVMLCSDWHVEEPVEPEKINGLNEYNLDIAAKCIDRLAEGYEWMLRDSRYDCREGIVWLGGDLLTGYIHPELMESNLLSPIEAQVWLLDHVEAMLRKILATTTLERVLVVCNSGNHGRTTDKQRVATRESNSFEQALYQTLARLFRDESRIEFQIAPGEWNEVDCMGFDLAFTHGDSFNYGGGVGGISIPIRRGISRQFMGRSKPIHQFCMGHFHTRQDFGDIMINGSMIGYSHYSQRIHAGWEPRQQSWFLMDSERGKCLSAPIWL